MALYRALRGTRANLPAELHDGYAYFCVDDGSFHIDYADADGALQRKQISAENAETLCGMSLEELQHSISWNNLLDKPFGEVEGEGTLILPETTFSDSGTTSVALDDYCYIGNYYYDKIVVEFDGVKYYPAMWSQYMGGSDIYGVGNGDLDTTFGDYVSGDASWPFCIIQDSTSQDYLRVSASTEGEHTIKMYVAGMVTQTLDEKYIPDTIARTSQVAQSDWSVNDSENPAYVHNRTHYQEVTTTTARLQAPMGYYTKSYTMDADLVQMIWENRATATYSEEHPNDTVILVYSHDNDDGVSFTLLEEGQSLDDTATSTPGYYERWVTCGDGNITYTRTRMRTESDWNLTISMESASYHQLAEEYIPDSIARISDVIAAQVQSDWTQNDDSSAAYVQNRTHYTTTEPVTTTFIDGWNANGYFAESSSGLYTTSFVWGNDCAEGDTLTVILDDTTYTGVVKSLELNSIDDSSYVYIGNASLYTDSAEDTGEDYYVVICHHASGDHDVYIGTPLTGTSHTITAYYVHDTEFVTQLDEKYIPETIARRAEVVRSVNGISPDNDGNVGVEISYNDLLDKPFYTTTKPAPIGEFDGREFTFTASGDYYIYNSSTMLNAATLYIEWDGVSYTCERGSDYSYFFYGASEMGGSPFYIQTDPIGFSTVIYSPDANPHTIRISSDDSGEIETVVQLDEKFIPDTIARRDDLQLENVGIHVGPDEPTDSNIKIWINTSDENASAIPLLPRIATVTLAASAWTGDSNPWSQVVEVASVGVNSKVDLQPTAIQIVALQEEEISLMLSNESGVVTAWAIGNKPTTDYTMQVLITEVAYV